MPSTSLGAQLLQQRSVAAIHIHRKPHCRCCLPCSPRTAGSGTAAVNRAKPAAAKRNGDLAAFNAASSVAQLSQALRKATSGPRPSTAAAFAALQQLCKLHATYSPRKPQKSGQKSQQQEQQQQVELAGRLLSQLAPGISRMSVGELCRLAFLMSQLQHLANVTPLWQAAARQLMTCTAAAEADAPSSGAAAAAAAAAAASDKLSSPHSTVAYPALNAASKWQTASNSSSSSAARLVTGADSAGQFAAGCNASTTAQHTARVGTAAEADKELCAGLAAAAIGGELLYLLRALSAWQWCEALHPVLLPAVVAALHGKVAGMQLQDLMLVAVSLARLRYYDAQLMQAAAERFVAAAQAQALPSAMPAAAGAGVQPAAAGDTSGVPQQAAAGRQRQQQPAQHNKQQQSSRHHQGVAAANSATPLAGITQQLLVNFLWSNASLAHTSEQLLSAAVQTLLPGPQATSDPNGLHAMSPRLAPLCSWSLATSLVCLLADRPRAQAFAGTQLLQHCAAVPASGSSSSNYGRLRADVDCSHADELGHLCELTHAVAAVLEALECTAAAAAAGAGSADRAKGRQVSRKGTKNGSSSSSSSIGGLVGVRYDQEGLAQVHHARLLMAAALRSVRAAANVITADTPAASDSSTAAGAEGSEGQPVQQVTSLAAAVGQCSAEQLAAFRQQCGAAWQQSREGRQATSYLQLQVIQALQGVGLQPLLEHPVQVETATTLQPQTMAAPNTLDGSDTNLRYSSSSSSSSRTGADDHQGSSVKVDIACLAPAQLVRSFQQQGLVHTLEAYKLSSSSGSCTSSSSGSSGTGLTPAGAAVHDVLLAVEVDGPSHVAVNCWGHALGSTVSRTWLLQQQGWAVLEVPWWEWEGRELGRD